MTKDYDVSFRTMLSLSEYNRLVEEFSGCNSNYQTNYYFDTNRFSLKAAEIVLRVKERDKIEIGLKRKKGFNLIDINEPITQEQFIDLRDNGVIPSKSILSEIGDLINGQRLVNYLSLSTYRIFLPYKHGLLAIDKVEYLGKVDYELEFQTVSRDAGKKEFVETVKELNIIYKKGDTKIKRAYNALKEL